MAEGVVWHDRPAAAVDLVEDLPLRAPRQA